MTVRAKVIGVRGDVAVTLHALDEEIGMTAVADEPALWSATLATPSRQALQGDPSQLVALTIVVAQAVMVLASLVAMRMADRRGYWLVILITFIALPVRDLLAASVIKWWGVFPVQILDGVGAGLQSVAVPGLVAASWTERAASTSDKVR